MILRKNASFVLFKNEKIERFGGRGPYLGCNPVIL